MRLRPWVWMLGLFCLANGSLLSYAQTDPVGRLPPNIVYILADDLGIGDVRCFNPEGKIATPAIDGLASRGMKFTDAHSGSAVCTPTRYGILTGRYAWRSSLKSGVLGGYSPRLIEPGRLTVPEFLHQQGYKTACIGKWHLGMNWPVKDEAKPPGSKITTGWEVDYVASIANGPTTVGFDRFWGISASLDMPPYVFIDGDHAHTLPTVTKTWIRPGPASVDFEAVDVLPGLAREATTFLEASAAGARTDKPFLLYLALTAPHTPILPTPEFAGRSGLNSYADFVIQVDAVVSQVLATIDRAGLAENTLVVFTSDNGCAPSASFPELRSHGHDPSAGFRGTKADIFEGGHRVPFVVRWPGQVAPGSTSDQVICLTDLFATLAAILDVKLPDSAAEDSVSILPALRSEATRPLREAVVHHSINGSFAIRQDRWKLALCPDSGGWSPPRPESDLAKGLPAVQLFDLKADRAETRNLEADHPELVERLTRLLKKYVDEGRSTPGTPQPNNGAPIRIHRKGHGDPPS